MLFVQIRDLNHKIQPIVELKPQIVNVINNITKVEKEIANIKEAIHQQYASFKTEVFKGTELGKTVTAYPDPSNPDNAILVFFELNDIPEGNSVQITDDRARSYARTSYIITSNVIALKLLGIKIDNILKGDAYYEIKYIPDRISNKEMLTIKNLEIKKISDKIHVDYKLKD